MSQEQFAGLRERSFQFAVRVISFCRMLPNTWEGRHLGGQLLRAGTAVGANYQAAGRSRSDREFISRLAVVIEEADESCFWLRLIEATGIRSAIDTRPLLQESLELLKIFSASHRTAKANRKTRRDARRATKSEFP